MVFSGYQNANMPKRCGTHSKLLMERFVKINRGRIDWFLCVFLWKCFKTAEISNIIIVYAFVDRNN